MIELKPCPFCGGKDIAYGNCDIMPRFDYAACRKCGAEIRARHEAAGGNAAVAAWNKRAEGVNDE